MLHEHPIVEARLERQPKVRWNRSRGSVTGRVIQWVVPISFFLACCLMLIQLASVTELFQVEVRINTGGNKYVIGESEWTSVMEKQNAPVSPHVLRTPKPDARDAFNVENVLFKARIGEGNLQSLSSSESNKPLVRQGVEKQVEEEDPWAEQEAFVEREKEVSDAHTDVNSPSELPADLDADQETENENDLSNRQMEEDGEGEESLLSTENTFKERAPIAHATYDGSRMTLTPQIELPKRSIVKAYNSDKNFWPWYRILRKHGWLHVNDVPDIRANMLFSKGAVPYLRKGKQMLNSIGVSGCIGGAKLLQLECRKRLAARYGCSFDDLEIQPVQYNMDSVSGCEAWYEKAKQPENADKFWLYKPSNTFHGKGIKLFKGPAELYKKLHQCKSTRSVIIMEYIANPATMQGGYKFDLRSYLLVGSLDPQLIFYADGFGRKSDTRYSLNSTQTTVHVTNSVLQKRENHFFSFDELSGELQREMGFSEEYMDKAREYMKLVSKYVFKTTDTQKKPLSRFPGRFHLFAIDWIIDDGGQIHLLEGNGYPLVTEYPIKGLTPEIWEDLIDLVLKVHVTPSELGSKMTVKDGFSHGKWSLIYNEAEDQWNMANRADHAFNPCREFPAQIHK